MTHQFFTLYHSLVYSHWRNTINFRNMGINLIIHISVVMGKVRRLVQECLCLNLSCLVSRTKPTVLDHKTCLDTYIQFNPCDSCIPGPCSGMKDEVMPLHQPGRLEPRYPQGQFQELLGSPRLGIHSTVVRASSLKYILQVDVCQDSPFFL